MTRQGAAMGRLRALDINRAGRHAIAMLISGRRTGNVQQLDGAETSELLDLLADVENELDPGAF